MKTASTPRLLVTALLVVSLGGCPGSEQTLDPADIPATLVVSGGTKPMGQDAVAWAVRCQELGAGALF